MFTARLLQPSRTLSYGRGCQAPTKDTFVSIKLCFVGWMAMVHDLETRMRALCGLSVKMIFFHCEQLFGEWLLAKFHCSPTANVVLRTESGALHRLSHLDFQPQAP
eukprot:SAG31_NODE_425_length_15822_cov_10.580758_12_plen_106_part_00